MAEYLVVGKPALLWLEKSLLWNNGVLWSASNRGALSIEKPTAANRFYWKCGFKKDKTKREMRWICQLLNKIKLLHLTRSCSFRAGTVIVLTILNFK
jgi:hypothetical protein